MKTRKMTRFSTLTMSCFVWGPHLRSRASKIDNEPQISAIIVAHRSSTKKLDSFGDRLVKTKRFAPSSSSVNVKLTSVQAKT